MQNGSHSAVALSPVQNTTQMIALCLCIDAHHNTKYRIGSYLHVPLHSVLASGHKKLMKMEYMYFHVPQSHIVVN